MPDDIQRAILSSYADLCADAGEQPVAVRSSATSEDGSEASFAGLQETFLWICGGESVLHAVRDCWASLYSAESVSYRLRLKLPEEGLAMGVVIQRMVNSRCSGVMFTRSPTTGDRSVIAIESSWGLGSSVVSGVVTPDKYVLSKVTGEIVKRTVSHKTVEHVPDLAAGGVRELAVSEDRRGVPCLNDAEIVELARIGKLVEAHYRCPQDIEWAFAPDLGGGESLYLLQSRPETIWANKDARSVAAPKANAFAHVFDLLGGAKKS
jgi:pyruvate,water dikinase